MATYSFIPLNDNHALLEQGINIIHAAFENNDATRCMQPQGATPAFRASVWDSILKVTADPVNADRIFYTGIVDNATGELTGLTCWRLYDHVWRERKQKKEAAQHDDEPDPHLGPGCNAEATAEFHGAMDATEERLMGGRDHWKCSVMVTKPSHQGKGVGRAGMQWGLERAGKDGLDIFLNATPRGLPLYEKLGFVTIGEIPFDCRKYGVDADYTTYAMLRPAVKS